MSETELHMWLTCFAVRYLRSVADRETAECFQIYKPGDPGFPKLGKGRIPDAYVKFYHGGILTTAIVEAETTGDGDHIAAQLPIFASLVRKRPDHWLVISAPATECSKICGLIRQAPGMRSGLEKHYFEANDDYLILLLRGPSTAPLTQPGSGLTSGFGTGHLN